jgi:hypothetical protein
MRITGFCPQILAKDAEATAQMFEALGFEREHYKSDFTNIEIPAITMKNADGFVLEISQPNVPLEHDVTGIRMNVDDFDAAYDMLIAKGFQNFYGDKAVDAPTSKSAMLLSPSRLPINLVEHIK